VGLAGRQEEKMNVYRCIGETFEHFGAWGEPPEHYADVGIVAANTRAQARYLFWKKYGDGETLTEFRAEIRKTAEVPFAGPKFIEVPYDAPFWMTPKELAEAAAEEGTDGRTT
jgi:hypothetical protein